VYALSNNPVSSSCGAFMPAQSFAYSVLLLTTDTTIQRQVRQIFRDASITVARDAASLQKDSPKHGFDIVVVESRTSQEQTTGPEHDLVSSRTLIIKGSRAVLRKALNMIHAMNAPNALPQTTVRDGSLESYLEGKMGEFVKGMRNGSARNLHPILIAAVERPLITSALNETRGNQIKAAELLGLNRNTLRKKIVDLHIPLKQTKLRAGRSA
jgi:DNA-binding protein Fis